MSAKSLSRAPEVPQAAEAVDITGEAPVAAPAVNKEYLEASRTVLTPFGNVICRKGVVVVRIGRREYPFLMDDFNTLGLNK